MPQKLRRKKKEGVMSVGGKIITVGFILLIIAGGYFLYTLFKPCDINALNMTGEWQLKDGSDYTYYYFEGDGVDTTNMSGTCSIYQKDATGGYVDKQDYSFTLEPKEAKEGQDAVVLMHLTAPRTEEVIIKITALSNAQMGIIRNGSDFANMRKTNIF